MGDVNPIRPSVVLQDHKQQVLDIVQRHGMTNPRIFGSVARGTDTPFSDLDLLVKVPAGSALAFLSLADDLENSLGIRVDVVSEGGITAKHSEIMREAVPVSEGTRCERLGWHR